MKHDERWPWYAAQIFLLEGICDRGVQLANGLQLPCLGDPLQRSPRGHALPGQHSTRGMGSWSKAIPAQCRPLAKHLCSRAPPSGETFTEQPWRLRFFYPVLLPFPSQILDSHDPLKTPAPSSLPFTGDSPPKSFVFLILCFLEGQNWYVKLKYFEDSEKRSVHSSVGIRDSLQR